jgi:N-acyl-D-amino-acid deacylase
VTRASANSFRACLFLSLSAVAAQAQEVEPLPVTGRDNPALAPFDDLMRSFVRDNEVPGAALAVSKNGRLVYARGFGFADAQKKEPVQPTALFRIASISKPITAVAALQLAEQGKLKLDEPMLAQLPPELRPEPLGDPRLEKITVRQLLRHTGGWDRSKSFDPMFRSVEIAKSENTAPPAGPNEIIRYMLRRKLDFEPGEREAYSNFGYCILGRIVERASGQRYEQYVCERVLAPLGIKAMRIGRTLPEGRAQGEVEYLDHRARTGPAVMGATIGRKVPLPYGAYYVEAMDAHGGWIASAVDLVRFASAFDNPAACKVLKPEGIAAMFHCPDGAAGYEKDGKPKAAYYACGWSVRPVGAAGKANTWHNGALAGTSTLLVRRHDGLNWAVLFNTDCDPTGKLLSGLIDGPLHGAANAVKQWPEDDLFGTKD